MNRRIFVMLPLGFASGLPLALTSGTLQAWLTVEGVDLKTIGIFTMVGLPYTLKFLWAPVMDRVVPPWFGRRRGWMVLTQLCVAVGLGLMAMTNPTLHPGWMAAYAVLVAFLAASLDIVFDAYRTDTLHPHERGLGAAVWVNGYRIALLASGAGALVTCRLCGMADDLSGDGGRHDSRGGDRLDQPRSDGGRRCSEESAGKQSAHHWRSFFPDPRRWGSWP